MTINLLIALCIGIVAGTIDVVPMLVQRLKKTACISAFMHYTVLGLIIPFVNWGISPLITGVIISFISAIPIIIIIAETDKKAIIPILGTSIVLGASIGLAGDYFIH